MKPRSAYITLTLTLAVVGCEARPNRSEPTSWSTGQTVAVEMTLVASDYQNLGCAMAAEVAGLYCAFTAKDAKRANVKTTREDPKLLQPFTTTDAKQFMAAGLWMQLALKKKLDSENSASPSPRFTASCKLKVEGRASAEAFVQWKPGEGWHPGKSWYVGTLSDCTIK